MYKIAGNERMFVNEVVPTLSPEVKGNFDVILVGCDGQFAELELRIVDPKTGQQVFSFGRKTIEVGGHIQLQGLESVINFNQQRKY